MNLLLDTHVLLWWLDANPSLSEKAKTTITDGNNLVLISAGRHMGNSNQTGAGQACNPF